MDSTCPTQKLPAEIENLINRSFEAMQFSYCPYSKFPVGVAVLCKDGTIYSGCNVENAAYPVGVCAEKVAISKAVSEGKKRFKAVAVASKMEDKPISPCGTCRQFLAEFGMDYDVYMLKADRTFVKTTVGELLPFGFSPLDLISTQLS